ncbi:bifunctional nuclease family protein [Flavobacteriaceae bacterium]|nr:bifunctional nuclease family protein [Flavobacteriaceae bacterium]
MDLVKLTIKGISYSQAQSGAYALILSELDGNRNLPVIIGAFEAQSIAIGLEKEINPPRPITHDLMAQCFERFKIIVKQIIIHKLVDGVFYSSLICERDEIEEIIDARTSDAVALSIRFDAPIFTYENILAKASYTDGEKSGGTGHDDHEWIKNFIQEQNPQKSIIHELEKTPTDELKKLLAKLVKKEDYESAAKVRDELSKRGEDE